MANPRPVTYYAPVSPIVAGRYLYATRTVNPDGVWCWFSNPRAVTANGATYIGWISSAGDIGITKYQDRAASHFTLHAALEVDDHNNPSVLIRPDGRIVCFYCKHNFGLPMYYRVSTNPYDISSFEPEQTFNSDWGDVTYANPHYLSQTGKCYLHFRSWGWGSAPNRARATSDFVTWDTERHWIYEPGMRPYVIATNNGVDRIDLFFTNCHPNEGASSLWHCYMQLDAGVEKFYKSDGTYIDTDQIYPASCTRIHDASGGINGWNWDIQYDSATGLPAVLYSTHESGNYGLCYSKWTGSAWTPEVRIANAGAGLYPSEPYYVGGACFDGQDTSIVYLSVQVGAAWEIQKWRTFDGGATWEKVQDITSGSVVKNCRPVSPKNSDGSIPVIWWAGVYNTFVDYDCALMAYSR